MTDRLPIFVYGTLRPRCHNARLYDGLATPTHDGTCWVEGYALVGGGFPYAVLSAGAESVGCLVWPDADAYDRVRDRLDMLEGYRPEEPERSHYHRTVVTVHTAIRAYEAWIYVPARAHYAEGRPVPTDERGRHDWYLARSASLRSANR